MTFRTSLIFAKKLIKNCKQLVLKLKLFCFKFVLFGFKWTSTLRIFVAFCWSIKRTRESFYQEAKTFSHRLQYMYTYLSTASFLKMLKTSLIIVQRTRKNNPEHKVQKIIKKTFRIENKQYSKLISKKESKWEIWEENKIIYR